MEEKEKPSGVGGEIRLSREKFVEKIENKSDLQKVFNLCICIKTIIRVLMLVCKETLREAFASFFIGPRGHSACLLWHER
jgi:hypothetical protein